MEHATESIQDLNLRLGVQLFNIILLFLSFLKRIRLEGCDWESRNGMLILTLGSKMFGVDGLFRK
jgi:hypothetical protein